MSEMQCIGLGSRSAVYRAPADINHAARRPVLRLRPSCDMTVMLMAVHWQVTLSGGDGLKPLNFQ